MSSFHLRATANAALLVLITAPALPTAFAQTRIDPVVVTGTREAQPLRDAIADVVLIDTATLRDSGTASLADVLQRYAGVQLLRNGGPGQTTGYFVRGASSNSTVVLIDGVRVGSATLGQTALEAMSLSQIDRIEVLRGPASGLYGADAVGGVIQVFTRKGQGAFNVTGYAAVGEDRSREGSFGLSGAQGGFDYAAGLSRETSHGRTAIRPNDQFGNYNPDKDGYGRTVGSARLGFTPAEGHHVGVSFIQSKLNAQYDGADYRPDFSVDPSADFRNRLTTRTVTADYRGQLSLLWTTQLQVAKSTDDLSSGGQLVDRFKTDRDQISWQNTLRFAPGQQLLLAYEHLREKAQSTVYLANDKRTNNAVFAGYTGQFGAAGVEASLRSDDNSIYGGNTTGSLGASYALSSTLKLRAVAGTTFRAPTFNDLDYPGYGVRSLQPEEGRSVELGLNWQSGNSSAGATVYRNKVRNLIGTENDPTRCPPGYDFGCATNTSRATLEGVTLTGAHRLGNLSLRATVDFLDAKNDDSGSRLIRRAAHQESISADYDTGVWSAGASLTDVGARPDGVTLGAYAVLDLRASWRFLPQWRLEAKLLNAADRDIQPVRDYQGLGRQAWVGVRYDMKGF
ncbi:TonB-dependent receptor domain-containing protein [Roseateles amylovorans]|uniref:TonB-dependent receptor n=1 Tax=Roseateles amylovorans TaxID=2978473 RepID=A0ABY6B5U6_9BURK|nr:TonB-dependent receptor [Roseateles amylovorans]UXH80733.1 TonB-dependent receptor [Roseateles amylovorans]